MTFWQFLASVWSFLSANGTKILGLAQGTVALLAGMDGIIPANDVKYWLATSAVLTFWRGFSNSSTIATTQTTVTKQEVKTDADTPEPKGNPDAPTNQTTPPRAPSNYRT
jgi:hypothetical protein